jgi:hypothetical protein
VTKELLLDCFDFDPEKWASRLITGFFFFEKGMDWEEAVSSYLDVVELCIWFQAQVRFRFRNSYIFYY